MASATYNTESKSFSNGYLFGAPLRDLGWFSSLLMGLAAGFVAFFGSTAIAIFTILFLNAGGHHADYTLSYRLIGLPIGILTTLCALTYLGTFWFKRKFRKA